MTTEAETRRPRLPACKNCSQKKVKCDNSRPRCHWCARNNVDCLILNSVTQQWLSRSYIDQLETKEAELAAAAGAAASARPGVGYEATAPAHPRVSSSSARDGAGTDVRPEVEHIDSVPSSTEIDSCPSTVTRGGGLNFIALLFSDADWRRSNADLLRSLAVPPRAQTSPNIEPCPLPPSNVVHGLFERYLSWSHVLAPFLLRQDVWNLHARIFSAPVEAADTHDLFRAFLICAIASVIPYRNGMHPQHPEQYYRSALKHLDSSFLTRGLASIQDLLLMCRFGVYHHIGMSIWDAVRLCGRLSTEQGLHCADGETDDMLKNQERRRVFWQFYLMDRYSSTMLDRPFAIDDRDVEIGFPADVNDEQLMSLSPAPRDPSEPSEVTVFIFCIRLRQISSRIHIELSRLRQELSLDTQPHLFVGRIYTTLDRLLQDLQAWHRTAPQIQSPRCLYESQGWHDFLHLREKMALVRKIVDLAPKTNGAPPGPIVSVFLRTGLETIEHYTTLHQRKQSITHTRSYLHTMFTAGLSVMYCVSVTSKLSQEDLANVPRGLRMCEDALSNMSELLPDAAAYVAVFETLRHHIMRKIPGPLATDATDSFHGPGIAEPVGRTYSFPTNFPAVTSTTGSMPGFEWAHDPMANMNAMGADQPLPDNLLQWAFSNDESIWTMDTMLGEYVYGDPTNVGLFDTFEGH